MEQWYKDGVTYGSQQAIKNNERGSSIPPFLTDGIIEELGYVKIIDVVPTVLATQRVIEGAVELVNGIPTKIYTVADKTAEELSVEQSAYMASVVQKFTDVTTAYIEAKVQAYNVTNGLAFDGIDAFTKYAIVTTSQHNAIAIKFITYADNIWKAVRTYQATATAIPTNAEFKAMLDGVVF